MGLEAARTPLNDSWIAATALAHGLAELTQNVEYHAVTGLSVLRLKGVVAHTAPTPN